MRRVVSLFVTLMVVSVGCSTTDRRQEGQTRQLENRVAQLEEELAKKNEEIQTLEEELDGKTIRRVSGEEGYEDQYNQTTKLSTIQVQTALKSAGFYMGSVDGKAGHKTKEAIKAFQKANGLKVDGVVGRMTSLALKEYLP